MTGLASRIPQILNIWKPAAIGSSLALIAASGAAVYYKVDGDSWEAKATSLQSTVDSVVDAVRTASGNKDVTKDTAVGQIVALGDEKQRLKFRLAEQSRSIEEMAKEALRLKARANELQIIADKARAQRAAGLRKLSDLTIAPTVKRDCTRLVEDANKALDLIYESGF